MGKGRTDQSGVVWGPDVPQAELLDVTGIQEVRRDTLGLEEWPAQSTEPQRTMSSVLFQSSKLLQVGR